MVKKFIPKHTSCLSFKNYLYYLRSLLIPYKKLDDSMASILGPLLGTQNILPMPTGRHALNVFLDTSGLEEGDEVLVSAYNFYVIVQILVQKNLKPKFVDIDPKTLCMDSDDLLEKITKKSRLVIVTHMFGNPADMKAISEICKKHHLLLFEDCAHAVGSLCEERHVGVFGDGALFSFGVYKIINAFGGGALVCSNPCILQGHDTSFRISVFKSFNDNFVRFIITLLTTPLFYTIIFRPFLSFLRRFFPSLYYKIDPSKNDTNYYFDPHTRAPFKSFMYKMIEFQLLALHANIAKRRKIVKEIKFQLQKVDGIKFLDEDRFGRSNCSYFGVYVSNPGKALKSLWANKITAGYPEYLDCSQLPQFSDFKADCPHASYAQKHILRLPNYPCLHAKEIERIVESIRLL